MINDSIYWIPLISYFVFFSKNPIRSDSESSSDEEKADSPGTEDMFTNPFADQTKESSEKMEVDSGTYFLIYFLLLSKPTVWFWVQITKLEQSNHCEKDGWKAKVK